ALRDLEAGEEIVVLTWLDRASRDVLRVHPRGDPANPETGVFSTRSPDRPNPIGLHRVEIIAIEGLRVLVRNLEALDGTPIIDVATGSRGSLIGQVLATESWAGAGIRSPEQYVAWQCGVSLGRARTLVAMARRLPELAETRALLEAGELAEDQVAVICRHVP